MSELNSIPATVSGVMVPLAELQAERRTVCTLADEIKRLRQTNQELNRRAQLAEKAARENINACQRKGVSLGRSLANWAYNDLARRMREVINPLNAERSSSEETKQ